jgi:hypothetical protein
LPESKTGLLFGTWNDARLKEQEVVVNKFISAALLSVAIVAAPLLAQEKNEMPMKGPMPMKEGMPIKGEAQGGMDMNQMKEMHGKMTETKNGMSGMMQGKGMMKSEQMKGMGNMMEHMSGMMGEMGHMMQGGKMSPEQMSEMSKMMGDMSGMMKQMSERMGRRMKPTK